MRRLWRPVLDSLTPYDAGKPLEELERELGLAEIIRLSANESPLGPSPRAVEAVVREARRAHLYPDGGGLALRRALAEHLGVAPEAVLLGNGADELLALIAAAAFEPGDEVVIPRPSFEPYGTAATLAGATPVWSPLVNYETDLADVAARVTPRTKALILCSPHNPAGSVIRVGPLERLLADLGSDPPLVILDEAYRDFAEDPEAADGVALGRRHPTLIALRTFSKVAGLAGLRVGYAVAQSEVIDRLNRVRAPYNVNRLAQAAALAALADREHWERTVRLVREERRHLTTELTRRGFRVVPSEANFLLVGVSADADALRERLFRSGILVRAGAPLGFPGHLRITVGTRAQNDRLLAVLDGARA
ncbi:MAG: histidinol-phosphate transaminase [Candidatus Rokubacteria bacterium]|nr:histidinol-phosphate transaminase [Candidatus Rokubacteria bacterium]